MDIVISHGTVRLLPKHHLVEPLTEHVPFLFHDCLGREIKVVVGIVRGFTERSILVDIIDDGYPSHRRGRDHTMPYKEWTLRKGHFNTGYNSCITGMTEMQIREMTETQEGVLGE